MMARMIVIAGTNASGKSGLGVKLAKRFDGEIISADSRQIYQGLDLGSGKITPEEMEGVPHHLIDIQEPGTFFSMADFQRLAYQAADDILIRGKTPFLVGGTGLYIDSVTEGYQLSDKRPDPELRERLETFSTPKLYEMLKERMPETEIDPKNRHRVMRVLEKLEAGDEIHPGRQARYETLKLGVTWPREVLNQRIDERLERRLAAGMADEVRGLLNRGVSETFLIKLGLEYKYLTWYVTGRMAEEQMKEELAAAIKKFAKRQMTWFRRDPGIHWLDMAGQPEGEAAMLIEPFLNHGSAPNAAE